MIINLLGLGLVHYGDESPKSRPRKSLSSTIVEQQQELKEIKHDLKLQYEDQIVPSSLSRSKNGSRNVLNSNAVAN